MARYAGEIKISTKNGFFVNFYPGYKWEDGQFVYLTIADLGELLSNSQYYNINLVSTSSAFNLEDTFQDGDDILLDFTTNDLQPNLKSDGSRYPTAWKLDLSRLGHDKIHRMEDFGYCYVPQNIRLDLGKKDLTTIELDSPDINEGMDILLPIEGSDNELAGPFKVFYDDQADSLYVRLNTESRKYVISGFSYKDGPRSHMVTLEQEDVTRRYVQTKGEGITPICFDRISDQELLENFHEILKKRSPKACKTDPAGIERMIQIYHTSLIGGYGLPEDIAQSRRERLEKMFDAHHHYETALDHVSKLAGSLLENFAREPVYSHVIHELTCSPEFLEHIDTFDAFHDKISRLERDVTKLEQEKQRMEEANARLRKLDPERQLALYHEEIGRLESLKRQADIQLTQTLGKANMSQTVQDLENRYAYLNEEIERKEAQSQQLDQRLESVQARMDDMLENAAGKALELSFDQLISSRFARQAALAERKEQLERYAQSARAIKHLPHSYFDDSQLVEYLIQGIKARRPDYSRNEILNLFICMTQGFLTLFTGAPGTGKTTICKTCAQVLGMNQPREISQSDDLAPYTGRFVQVGVERGWNSRRDWIGFYNSLLRTFDKASPYVFDLLSILDQESRSSLCATGLPAMILLDDANLSSMEYYWADFMSMSDPNPIRGMLSLGENYTLNVPSSLRFAAIVHTDHTTEPLSRRLLDRAWVIALPNRRLTFNVMPVFENSHTQLILEEQLQHAFGWKQGGLELPASQEELLNHIMELFVQAGLLVSTRCEMAMRRYWNSAVRWFEDDNYENQDAATVALDYAVSQRLVPSIAGSSERFRMSLEKIKTAMQTGGLYRSARLVADIMERGDNSMQYYQFFG